MRGATVIAIAKTGLQHISIHAPRAGSDGGDVGIYADGQISIHAPRAGSDPERHKTCSSNGTFQSTLPVRGATYEVYPVDGLGNISIHAPRAGSDIFMSTLASL